MKIDNVNFVICLNYANGKKQLIHDGDTVQFDYGNSRYGGFVSSIRRVDNLRGTSFVLYIHGVRDNDNKLRTYDVPLWQVDNLEIKEV